VGTVVAQVTTTILQEASKGPLGALHPVATTAVIGPQGNAPAGE
jgi:hypothetical protein